MESIQAIEKIGSTPGLAVKDFEDGTVKLQDVLEEVQYLKAKISDIRQQMATFLTGLTVIQPSAKPQQVFEENVQRVTVLKKSLDEYVGRYKKLVPLLEVVQKEMDVKGPEKIEPSLKPPTAPAAVTAPAKKPRKRSYTKKGGASNASTPQGAFTPQSTIQEAGRDGSQDAPILL